MSSLTVETLGEQYKRVAESSGTYTWLNYQPIHLPGYEHTLDLSGRNCFDRRDSIVEALTQRFGTERLKIIDWGCNLGFFVFELAKLGHEVVGIDSNRNYIDICRFLADSNEFPVQPRFYVDKLSKSSLTNYRDFDVAICFSVLHHLGKQIMPVLRQYAETYPVAFIEMDGRDFGRHLLFTFYHGLHDIIETNDPYGSSTKRRKTWLCSNKEEGLRFTNIKTLNLIGGRSVLKSVSENRISVLKREELKCSHTWIKTNLTHEIEMYQKWGESKFFPALLAAGENDRCRWMEIEYIHNDEKPTRAMIEEFFSFLQKNELFLLDLGADSFLCSNGRLKVVDLESLFVVDSTIADLISDQTRRSSISLDSYEKQCNYIMRKLL